MTSVGFPHSDIPGSMLACSSPRLFAACHVLHRRLMPRHPPCALIRLTEAPPEAGLLLKPLRISPPVHQKSLSRKRTPQADVPLPKERPAQGIQHTSLTLKPLALPDFRPAARLVDFN